jgi:hypothetical protein
MSAPRLGRAPLSRVCASAVHFAFLRSLLFAMTGCRQSCHSDESLLEGILIVAFVLQLATVRLRLVSPGPRLLCGERGEFHTTRVPVCPWSLFSPFWTIALSPCLMYTLKPAPTKTCHCTSRYDHHGWCVRWVVITIGDWLTYLAARLCWLAISLFGDIDGEGSISHWNG